jgi:exosortase J
VRRLAPSEIAVRVPMNLASTGQVRGTLLRAGCLLALAVAAHTVQARDPRAEAAAPLTMTEAATLLPAHVGPFSLQRTYGEQQSGVLMMVLGEYTTAPSATTPARRMTLGFYLPAAYHLVVVSKRLQGVYPAWTGSLDAQAQRDLPATLATSFYDDGTVRQENAEAVCTLQRCFAAVPGQNRIALEMNVGSAADLALGPGRRIPILLRREWPVSDPRPPAELTAAFAQDARGFLGDLDLRPVVESAGHRP